MFVRKHKISLINVKSNQETLKYAHKDEIHTEFSLIELRALHL